MLAVSKIEQPGAINWASIPPFTPTSQDVHLHQIALKSKSKYKASTSSISGLFSHVYQVMSNFRPVDTSSLSKAFEYQSKNFSGIVLRKPANVILRTKVSARSRCVHSLQNHPPASATASCADPAHTPFPISTSLISCFTTPLMQNLFFSHALSLSCVLVARPIFRSLSDHHGPVFVAGRHYRHRR